MPANVLIYNETFFELSETFVYQQALLVHREFNIFLFGKRIANKAQFPTYNMSLSTMTDKVTYFENFIFKLRWKLGLSPTLKPGQARALKRYIVENNIGLIHTHFGVNAVEILSVVRALNIPLIVTFHGYDASQMVDHQPRYKRALPALIEYASKILVVSNHMIGTLGIPSTALEKVELYPCAIDTQLFRPVLSTTQDRTLNLLHSGRLVNKKGVPDLVRVFSRLCKIFPDVKLHILGGGEELSYVTDLVHDLDLTDRVVCYGSQPHAKVKELMGMADIFVLNSRIADNGDMEGLPVTLLEAMSMQMAIVSTRHAGIPHAIEHGINGLLVDERDNDQLFEALKDLIENATLRSQLAARARTTAEEKFDLAVVGKRLVEIYQEELSHSAKQ